MLSPSAAVLWISTADRNSSIVTLPSWSRSQSWATGHDKQKKKKKRQIKALFPFFSDPLFSNSFSYTPFCITKFLSARTHHIWDYIHPVLVAIHRTVNNVELPYTEEEVQKHVSD